MFGHVQRVFACNGNALSLLLSLVLVACAAKESGPAPEGRLQRDSGTGDSGGDSTTRPEAEVSSQPFEVVSEAGVAVSSAPPQNGTESTDSNDTPDGGAPPGLPVDAAFPDTGGETLSSPFTDATTTTGSWPSEAGADADSPLVVNAHELDAGTDSADGTSADGTSADGTSADGGDSAEAGTPVDTLQQADAESSHDASTDRPVAVDVAAGDFHTCALFDNGAVKCWGFNDQGQLGQGDTRERGRGTGVVPEMGSALGDIELGTGAGARLIVAGAGHTCALLNDGRIKCWGGNSNGQLGLGDSTNRGTGAVDDPGMGDALPAVDLGSGRTAVDVAAGAQHTCALLDNGEVKCWGSNFQGQLGLEEPTVRGAGWEGDPGMGDALPAVDLGSNAKAIAIDVGAEHSCALLDNGSAKCWGANSYGQLGQGNTITRGAGAPSDPGMGDALDPIGVGENRSVLSISAGYAHTCALLDDHSLACWGRNRYGQLGLGDTLDRSTPSSGGGRPVGRQAVTHIVAASGYHTCALLEGGKAQCWGYNEYGQLGQGDTVNWGTGAGDDWGNDEPSTPVDLGTDLDVFAVAAGFVHTCFLTSGHSIKCCGSNVTGQLGYGDVFDRCDGDAAFPMGDGLAAVPLQ